MSDIVLKLKRNRLLRAIGVPCLRLIAKTGSVFRTSLLWLSPGRLSRYGRLMIAKHRKTTFIGKVPTIGCLMELDPNHWITQNWYVRADYEKSTFAGLRRFLHPGMVCMDIGANAGLFTLFMATRVGEGGKVYSFEPTFSTYQRLQKNIGLNNLHNVISENVAVTEKSGTVEFHVGPSDLSVYNSIADVVHPGAKDGQFTRISVPAVSIDDYCAKQDIRRVDCVKIDVEGAELMVLKGMRRILETNGSIMLLIEFGQITGAAFGSSVEVMAEWLLAEGFQLFTINKKGGLSEVMDVIPNNGEMVWAVRPAII